MPELSKLKTKFTSTKQIINQAYCLNYCYAVLANRLLFRQNMKQAIKVLEKRIELLGKEWDKKDAEFDNCEMVCDHEFLQNDLANIELEIIELQKAIKLLNDNVV